MSVVPGLKGGHLEVEWTALDDGARLRVSGPDGADSFRFMRVGHRLRLGLELAVRAQPIDISINPATVTHAITPVGRDEPPGDIAAAVVRWVAGLSGQTVGTAASLATAVVGAACFPILREAYERGAGAIGQVPRWAATSLSTRDAREFADTATGRRCSGPLVRALATSLDPSQVGLDVSLFPLALVRMGSPMLDDARLARIVSEATWRPPGSWPSQDDVIFFPSVASRLGPARVNRILRDASQLDDGPTVLVDVLALLRTVGRSDIGPLANGLRDLRDQLRAAHPSRTRPPSPVQAPVPAPPRPLAPQPRRATPARALGPPTVRRPASASVAQDGMRAIRHLHGLVLAEGRLRLVVPKDAAELQEWGRRLHNCLGSFGPVSNAGASQLIGVEVDHRLSYCLELDRSGSVRQFLAARNRPVPRADARAVVACLVERGVLSRTASRNQQWLRLLQH